MALQAPTARKVLRACKDLPVPTVLTVLTVPRVRKDLPVPTVPTVPRVRKVFPARTALRVRKGCKDRRDRPVPMALHPASRARRPDP